MNFHNTIRPILVIFLLFGQFPLYGVLTRKPLRWHFRWCSLQTVLSLGLIHVGLFLCFVEYDRLKAIGVNADNLIGPLFYLDVIIIMLLLLRVAYRWPTVVPKWEQIESLEVMQYNARQQNARSCRRIRAIALLLIVLGFGMKVRKEGRTHLY
uniref:gustatory receptor for sugar taste 64e-like n=1 Tax=Anopheles coluzzii TaxID=1518534 RepID=UPI001AAC7228|nr:gustatory receptor for sugar taste 64e-like [Anopheles coluzzii]